MSNSEQIIRIAAKGDGVTATGQHVSGALPGDEVDAGKITAKGGHHVAPPCPHFGPCGGCLLQHADEATLCAFARDRVVNAAAGQDLNIGELLKEHLSPPKSRRRATLHAMRTGKSALIGYREAGSHRIVDLRECHVITPELAELVGPLRGFIGRYGPRKGAVDVQLSLCDQGVDVGLTNFPLDGLEAIEASLDFARERNLARLTLDQGYGPESQWEPDRVTVTLGNVPVALPSGAFLQATHDAENLMIEDAREWLSGAGLIADLFSGLGTFAFALREGREGRKVLAVEADQAAHLACKAASKLAGGTVHALHRDLFRSPLMPDELNRFDAVLLDPPRAGAKDQIEQIAASSVGRVVYISCNPSSWARDAATLTGTGFKLAKLRPIGQFRWSNHVELVSLFER
ncbi:class I SAM-dependent RNA methyltransferase [Erythrobacter insulae]|uniref:Class I SAM-dependent RNA methyltransferase n=1 Tax=Erythrobacter insulae TaxID=2584124 RepID=A0A547PEE4_9SPHN|nr:class I SAM-dependent RNA methyltransferase [Erythrobacter insulae]TRD12505.1 class I SAM-dependent RNA methyltransferase [Erythrobacter insulae]